MLNKWKPFSFLAKPHICSLLSSLTFFKPSFSVARLVEEEPSLSHSPKDPVSEILSGMKIMGFMRFLAGDYFRNVVLSLDQLHVDKIINSLRVESPDFALVFFDLMRNEYRFRHSRFSRFVVAHVLAGQRRLEELRFVVDQMLKEEGTCLVYLINYSFFSLVQFFVGF